MLIILKLLNLKLVEISSKDNTINLLSSKDKLINLLSSKDNLINYQEHYML